MKIMQKPIVEKISKFEMTGSHSDVLRSTEA